MVQVTPKMIAEIRNSYGWAHLSNPIQRMRLLEEARVTLLAALAEAEQERRQYHCSCGATLTAEEYIKHYFEMGHDRPSPPPATPEVNTERCAGLEGCRELEGVMYDLFVHDPECPKGPKRRIDKEGER